MKAFIKKGSIKSGESGTKGFYQIPGMRYEGKQQAKKNLNKCSGFLNLVGERGFEPPTHWSQTSCATKLRYSPMGAHITALPA